MKRFLACLTALLFVASGSGPDSAAAAETNCCWLYCETYRDICRLTEIDPSHCDAWYEGCIDGCQYRKQ